MDQQDKPLSEKQSFELITAMINKAKDAYYDTGVSAIMWGAIIAFCALEKLAELQFGYTLPFDIYLLTLIAIIPQVYISAREHKERRVVAYDDAYMNYIWLAFGICIFLMIFIVNVVFNAWEPMSEEFTKLTGQPARYRFHEYISSLFLLLYGLPTFITGAACKFKPMFWGGIICWTCCIAALFTNIKIDLLLTAASAIMAWLIPGIIIQKEYNIYKKQRALANV